MVCDAWSRDPRNCEGPQSGCYKLRRGLSEAEKIKRDRCEEAQLKAGKSLGYQRTSRGADSAAANASDASPGDAPRSREIERK
eukprot:1689879-Pyramimonas_sp.AAC.1